MSNTRHCVVCNKEIPPQEQQGVTTLTARPSGRTVTFCSGACFDATVRRLTSLAPTTPPKPRRRRTP